MKLMLTALLLLLAPSLWGAAVSVPVAVTPPAPAAFTATVSQPATVNGVIYTVTGTLTFTPASVTGSLPLGGGNPIPPELAALPDGTLKPLVAGYKSSRQAWATTFSAGDTVFIEGRGWGPVAGTVALADIDTPPIEWLDEEIGLVVPPLLPPAPNGVYLSVMRPDGAFYAGRGFVIAAAPKGSK